MNCPSAKSPLDESWTPNAGQSEERENKRKNKRMRDGEGVINMDKYYYKTEVAVYYFEFAEWQDRII